MIFIFEFVSMASHIDLFEYIQGSLDPGDKAHMITMYDPFPMLFARMLLWILESAFLSDTGFCGLCYGFVPDSFHVAVTRQFTSSEY